jgi:pimeloyl-ACP methyl ester carboxylesterase
MAVLPLAARCGATAQTDPRRKIQTSILEVPGARLYYETHGSGPVMLMVPGASGTADSFRRVTEHLAAHYTVVIHDRRGFSRSKLDGPQDYAHRLETDADDVRRLVEHLSDKPATLFGSSSGGIIVLKVLTRHPSVVRTLVPHEPAAVRLLPDGQKRVDFFFEVYDLYRQSGIEPALKKFREQTFAESDRQHMAGAPKNEYTLANATYWFEHELRQYPAVDLDLGALKVHADRIVPVAGRESRGYPAYEVNVELSKKLGREWIELPGGHIGFNSQPAEFAREFVQALARTGSEAVMLFTMRRSRIGQTSFACDRVTLRFKSVRSSR